MSHTEGRMQIHEWYDGNLTIEVLTDEGVQYLADIEVDEDNEVECGANAERIKAAWNAAHDAGLSTEALEQGVVKEALRKAALLDEALRHIDALLVVCGQYEPYDTEEYFAAKRFREAGRATGEQR